MSRQNWRGGGELLLKMVPVQWRVTLINYVIDRAGFTLHGTIGFLEIFAKSSCKYM